MTPAQSTAKDIAALRADLSAMGHDMKKLMADAPTGVGGKTPDASENSGHSNGIDHSGFGSLGTDPGKPVHATPGLLQRHPVLSLSLAVGLGWLCGRLLMR
jgi:hypothetical protein